jgi:hypothetical protein
LGVRRNSRKGQSFEAIGDIKNEDSEQPLSDLIGPASSHYKVPLINCWIFDKSVKFDSLMWARGLSVCGMDRVEICKDDKGNKGAIEGRHTEAPQDTYPRERNRE